LARCLIIGCGCRGRLLAGELAARGHAVRGTTRRPASGGAIEAAGAEAVIADPDRVATLVGALDHVSVACVMLGSASGPPDALAALHGTRLEMLLTKIVDTTIRGVVYEASGSVEAEVLREGAERVRRFGRRSMTDVVVLEADPSDHRAWVAEAADAVVGLL
jgi:saccharopine dehydrogenase-like NADP-dependent oxidoreductase